MTHADKLKAIIKKQVEGGYGKYKHIRILKIDDNGKVNFEIVPMRALLQCSVLEVLFDTQSLKAAYGEEENYWDLSSCECGAYWEYNTPPNKWQEASAEIAEAWHSGEKGNNWQAAIDTAYDLLPTEQ